MLDDVVTVSEKIYADRKVWAMDFPRQPMPSPYVERPFLTFEEAVPHDACRDALATLEGCDTKAAALRGDRALDRSIRDTLLHPLTPQIERLYEEAVGKYRSKIERFFAVALGAATRPQLLEYREGGRYRRHADNASELVDSRGELVGYRVTIPERKVTTLLFLNTQGEDFTGGALLFNHLVDEEGKTVTLKPRAGTLLAFPSHPLFAHEVEPVQSGRRFAIAQWHDAVL
ncbi:2OG-Fe(II) oxygenase [Hydrogenimonas sp. SS33]|uniref:2OG-Fe(II) oxygenase n=1 Tax=Hydrogenimonas leucolamina TaxID=2954236 RepID=UPI00336C084F